MRWIALLLLAACSTPKAVAETHDATSASTVTSASAPVQRSEKRSLRMVEAAADEGALGLIRTRRLEAKADGRVLVVYVGATWCEPCKRFKSEVQAGRLDERLGNITLLAFDADKDADRLAAAGYTFKFVPNVALPGADGHPADTQQATGHGGDAWRELLAKLDAWSSS